MKRIIYLYLGFSLLFSLSACSKKKQELIDNNVSTSSSLKKKESKTSSSDSSSMNSFKDDRTPLDSSNKSNTEQSGSSQVNSESSLSSYSDEQIEYSRVWLVKGLHTDIDELNILKIPAGTLINPLDESSSKYPTDVIQLSGSRLVDGSITYKSNGDGSITTYEIPLRWEFNVPDNVDKSYMSKLTQSMIDNGQTIIIPVGNPDEVIKLINIENIH